MILIKTSGKQFPLDDNPIEIDLTGCNKDKLELILKYKEKKCKTIITKNDGILLNKA